MAEPEKLAESEKLTEPEEMFEDFIEHLPEVLDENDNPIVPAERRIIFTISGEKTAKEWFGFFDRYEFDDSALNYIKAFAKGLLIIPAIIAQTKLNKRKKFVDKYDKYPVIDIENAQKHFKFPPNHPQHNTLYAMCDILPNFYVPLSIFHEYIEQMKHSSFLELCAALGAKEIYYESDETNSNSLNINASSNTPVDNINFSANRNKNVNLKLAYEFAEKNTVIKDYQSEWLDMEPTWKTMKKMRIENHVKSFVVEYNYTDDFGVNASVAANINGFGFNIGGEFKEMKMKKFKYNVLFWDI